MENKPIIVDGVLLNPTTPFKKMKGCRKLVNSFEELGKQYKDGGTVLISNATVVKMKDGYQVSFMRPENEIRFTDEEYDEICNYIMKITGSRLFAGFWAGNGKDDPGGIEPSFWCKNKRVAKIIARLFNQKSIFNWKVALEGREEEIYVPIKPHTDGLKLDKEAILRKIREEK